MEANLLSTILIGGILGIIGQGIRIVLGIGKGTLDVKILKEQILLTLIIGFIAGTLAIILKNPIPKGNDLYDKEILLYIISAGYAGADFIEGTLKAIKNKFNTSQENKQKEE